MDNPITEEDRGELTPEELERLTAGLIDDYRRLRGLDSTLHRVKPRHMKMWERLAKALHDQGIPLRPYMYWAYKQFRRNCPHVYVEQITSPKTITWYRREAPDRDHDTQVLVRLQWATLKASLDQGMTPREIVESPDLELGVVFKYALACHAQLTDLAESMKSVAESEIFFEPAYSKYLGDFLPAERENE